MSEKRPADGLALTLFERNLKQALRLFNDPERLGQESPLAHAYMLSSALRAMPGPASTRDRGAALCAAIGAAAARLWGAAPPASRAEMLDAIVQARRDPDSPRYAYVVLELRCFQRFVAPNKTSDIWEQDHLLPGSKSQHYRDFDAAVKALAPLLLDALRPALRPEHVAPPQQLYGYHGELELLAGALGAGRAVLLSGPGGAGKTSLAAAAIARLGPRPVFWYTVRPDFNDGPSSLLFALGAFLHNLGASNLWQYLAVSGGVVGDLHLAAGLLREDLAAAAGLTLCFDDLEHLAAEARGGAGAQILDLIDGLRGSAPLLLISQRPLLAADLHVAIAGLDRAETERFWRDGGRALSPAEAARLHDYTGGNMLLLTLMLAAHSGDEAPPAGPDDAVQSLLPAFRRLWRRLAPAERLAVQRLSVYPAFAPEELFDEAVLALLARMRLVERDALGGVVLRPALAPLVRDDLAPELRGRLHQEAAVARLERAEYTAAAFHFVAAGRPDLAVQAWFPQRQLALGRGDADAARAIFAAVEPGALGGPERKALDLILAELHQRAGASAEGLRAVEEAAWDDDGEPAARLWMLRGELEDALGYPERALTSYAEGLQVTTRLLAQLAAIQLRRAALFRRQRDLGRSWAAIHRAEFDLEILRGQVLGAEGAYDNALAAYGRALALAERLGDDGLRAQAEFGHATIYGRRQEIEACVRHATAAMAIYERIGDRANLEQVRSAVAASYVQVRRFEEALAVGEKAYAFYVAVADPYYIAVTGANLAEAAYEIGDLARAERYATEVLAQDSRFAAPYARFTLGQIALARGDAAAAARAFAAAAEQAASNDDPFMAAYARRSHGQARLAAGDRRGARDDLAAALATFRELKIDGEATATEALLRDL